MALRPRSPSTRVAAVADPATAAGTTGATRLALRVEGMHCANCARSVERALTALEGVSGCSVNAATGLAAVDFDPARLTAPRLAAAITAAGFTPVLPADASRTAAAGPDRARLERRTWLKRIGLAGLGMMQTMMFVYCLYAGGNHGIDPDIARYLRVAGMLITTPVLLYSGAPFLAGALRDLRRGSLGMDVPVALALVLAYAASVINTLRDSGEVYFDSVTMFIFLLLVGRYVEMIVRHRSLSATEALTRSLPATARRLRPDGTSEEVLLGEVRPGDRLLVARGAVVPVDGSLTAGTALLDESLITGESTPVRRGGAAGSGRPAAGDSILGGSVNIGHPIEIRARAAAADSTLASIVALLERAQAQRPALARTADRAASWFIRVILLLAIGVGVGWWLVAPAHALPALLAVLVVTCPCALSLATPAVLAAATTRLARSGLMVVRTDAIERLAHVDLVVLDKTGTLTCGAPRAQIGWLGTGTSAQQALGLAAALERGSDHPLATAFRPFESPELTAGALREMPGQGVEGRMGGRLWRIGRREFVAGCTPAGPTPEPPEGGASVYLGCEAGWIASFAITDALRPQAGAALESLRALGLELAVASGDAPEAVGQVATALGIRQSAARLTPAGKLQWLQARQREGRRTLMIGDGINDGPVLAAADVSCAMAQGSAVAQCAADLLLMSDSLTALPDAITTARRTLTVMRQNLVWAFCYNVAGVPLAALGMVPPWVAAIGMSASSLLVVLNASRLARRNTQATDTPRSPPGRLLSPGAPA